MRTHRETYKAVEMESRICCRTERRKPWYSCATTPTTEEDWVRGSNRAVAAAVVPVLSLVSRDGLLLHVLQASVTIFVVTPCTLPLTKSIK